MNIENLRVRIETVLKKYGPMSAIQVAVLVDAPQRNVSQALINLSNQNRVAFEGPNGKRVYSLKVRKPSIATRPANSFRDRPMFTGIDWSASIQRPGCQDALKCPSRRGDTLVPYRPPILNASSLRVKSDTGERLSTITQWK